MKIKRIVLLLAVLLFGTVLTAADHLAVAEPVGKGAVKPEEVEALWGMLESSVDGGYLLISRSALKQIMTEAGLTSSSELVNLNSTQKARLGEIKGVKYLLVSSVARIGAKLNLSLMVVDSSTGEIDPDRKTSETVSSMDEMADKVKDMLNEMNLGRAAKKRGISALLAPIIKTAAAPDYLAEDFNVRLEENLLENNVKLQNLQSVRKILQKNGIGSLNEVEPSLYMRIGELLRVDSLIQPTINRFDFSIKKEYIKTSKRTVVRCLGNMDGNIRIISAQTGAVTASIPFREKVDFDDLDSSETEDWTATDYGKYLIEHLMPAIAPKVLSKLK